MSIWMEVNAPRASINVSPYMRGAEGRNRRQHGA